MAEWKKVIVSGSDISQLNNDSNYITNNSSNVILSGSFSGSFQGDGSGLTGIASTLNGNGDTGGFSVDLLTQTLTVQGTSNEISTSASGQTITIGLPDNIVIQDSLSVLGDLTVIGTASFQNTTNLEVADRFVLFASGSNTTGDGGIVIQQATQDVGEVFGWDAGEERWSVETSFNASTPNITPDAFMSAVTTLSSTNPNISGPDSRYDKIGNIYISSNDESIWIYS